MDRVILHCDCNSFFASVECVGREELKHVPVAVCGDPKNRHGVILAKNDPAKRCGVRTAETVWQALQKCPELVLLPPHYEKYQEYCDRINGIYTQYTDQVEPFSIDESWLDVTGSRHLFGSGPQIADALRARVRKELDITISVGVSYNKVFAKMGSDYKKPDATTVITRENFRELLWPLPVGELLFVGRVAAETLHRNGIKTIGELAHGGRELASALLGKSGEQAWDFAMGLDESPVRRYGESDPAKSIGNGMTFRRDLVTAEDIRAGLTLLCDQVGTRLRRIRQYAATLQVHIKGNDFKVICRQRKLADPTNSTQELLAASEAIVAAAWTTKKPIRALTVTASQLTGERSRQVDLFTDPQEREKLTRLDEAMDAVRRKYGNSAVKFGASLQDGFTEEP